MEPKMSPGTFVSVKKIAEVKRNALRRGIWFKVLNRVERGALDLTMKYVDNIRSTTLAKLVTAIINKLTLSMESVIDRMVNGIGRTLAQKISRLAVNWGNFSASKWADDRDFAWYLVVCFPSKSGGRLKSC